MTNILVGDVYAKIIEEVINTSMTDFEESGVSQTTLQELRQEWQSKLSQRGVAHMPWEPKPQPAPLAPPPSMQPAPHPNGLPSASYAPYDTPPPAAAPPNNTRIKAEPTPEAPYNGMSNGYPQEAQPPAQGGLARATQLVQQQYGPNASASLSAMQRGLALPGQQQQQQQQMKPPQGLHLPEQMPHPQHSQYPPQQQQHPMMRQQLQQQQQQPRVKVENDSAHLAHGGFPPQTAQPNYGQTDGADDPYQQWQEMLAQRRAFNAEHGNAADRAFREEIMQHSADLSSGLLVPLDEQPKKRHRKVAPSSSRASGSAVPQLDGEFDDDDEDQKPDIKPVKDEDDENAINSDLDDSDDDAQGQMGDDDDELGDQILCTYDKVQRVKNKWKCVLKDGVMSVQGKEWVFHKGTGEFEW